MANHGLCFFVLLLSSTTHGYFIQMLDDSPLRWADGRQLCEVNGMTLPVLPTEQDFDNFTSLVAAIALSKGMLRFQAWLGLTHDGGNGTAQDHMTWTDGQPASYTRSRQNSNDLDAHFNVSAPFFCIRLIDDNMKLSGCNLKRDVICQGSLGTQTAETPTFYVKTDHRYDKFTNTTRFHVTTSDSQLPVPLNLRSAGPQSSKDVIECFQQCAQTTSCHVVAILKDKSFCYLQL